VFTRAQTQPVTAGGTLVNLSVQIGKLTLQNPVTVASGTFSFGVGYSQLLDLKPCRPRYGWYFRNHAGKK
jgi:hypothetical protein